VREGISHAALPLENTRLPTILSILGVSHSAGPEGGGKRFDLLRARMPEPKYIVRLMAEERCQLEELIRTGKRATSVLTHARIKLKRLYPSIQSG